MILKVRPSLNNIPPRSKQNSNGEPRTRMPPSAPCSDCHTAWPLAWPGLASLSSSSAGPPFKVPRGGGMRPLNRWGGGDAHRKMHPTTLHQAHGHWSGAGFPPRTSQRRRYPSPGLAWPWQAAAIGGCAKLPGGSRALAPAPLHFFAWLQFTG